MVQNILHFFFDYGAGGCLWSGDKATSDCLGSGPVDAAYFDQFGNLTQKAAVQLSNNTTTLIEKLDFQHSGFLNPKYPPDPSLWSQKLCDEFNAGVEILLLKIINELGTKFRVIDKQKRYAEDPELADYLKQNVELSALDEVIKPTVY